MTEQSMRRLSLTETLTMAAVLVGGLFGSLLDRSLVATPAWQRLGVSAWADYSRQADLGNGDLVYPVGAILWWGLVIGAAIAYRRDAAAPRTARYPIYLAVGSVLGAIGSTVIAAPIMQHVGTVTDSDISTLHNAFQVFTVWGVYVRGAFFGLVFVSTVWALVALLRHRNPG
ncbi:hypothetical protein [Mycobacterium angelicum]|uniref:DUF1772 domain-containing protein n=1 Tax=Mycobacterium angelicum TaxID=470074 RepID=A0A1W9ZKS7_MYCAN|nr:hypothetical protein [Mycobacterium angelicum]MCV7199886.1 hypothetical protein [Mycobacterium angelicum]ORA17308.1 hypothetical protein BST12_19760 [Mycobacterium angelicum]